MKTAFAIIGAVIVFIALTVGIYTCNKVKENTTDNAFQSYEEFQSMYNTCVQLNADLCTLDSVKADDPMFAQFSKSSRINTKRQQMNRWINEYNAKSNMKNRALWKSQTLPSQLTTAQFNCY